MKGWSFNGLVKALKSAAFKDVGASVGQIPLVGDSGLLSSPANISAADFNNIEYKSGATFNINPPYKNWPFGSTLDEKVSWYVCVDTGQGLSGSCILRIFRLGTEQPVCIAKRDGATSWSFSLTRFNRELTEKNNPNSLIGDGVYGDWYQTQNANALLSLGYPIKLAGTLSVNKGPYGAIQEYTTNQPVRKYVRSYASQGSWGSWVEFIPQQYDSTTASTGLDIKKGGSLRMFRADGSEALTLAQTQQGISLSAGESLRTDVRGWVKAFPRNGSWHGSYDEPDFASSFGVGSIVAPGTGNYFPLLSCRIENGTGARNATGVSFGVTNNSSTKHSAVISLSTRDGEDAYKNFYFTWAGSIDTPRGRVAVLDDLSNHITSCRITGKQSIYVWRGPGYYTTIPYVLTGLLNNNQDEYPDVVERCALQYYTISKGWVNFAS